ncbi:MAG: hypothetical protein KBS54_00575 [Synergistaceae bacterium]|nr:hypothetical protein [Candidatus Equadaptatus faecalis]
MRRILPLYVSDFSRKLFGISAKIYPASIYFNDNKVCELVRSSDARYMYNDIFISDIQEFLQTDIDNKKNIQPNFIKILLLANLKLTSDQETNISLTEYQDYTGIYKRTYAKEQLNNFATVLDKIFYTSNKKSFCLGSADLIKQKDYYLQIHFTNDYKNMLLKNAEIKNFNTDILKLNLNNYQRQFYYYLSFVQHKIITGKTLFNECYPLFNQSLNRLLKAEKKRPEHLKQLEIEPMTTAINYLITNEYLTGEYINSRDIIHLFKGSKSNYFILDYMSALDKVNLSKIYVK